MFISTKKLKAKHEQKPLDIYYSNLEEAYGNLPVPSDDWAGVESEIKKFLFECKTKPIKESDILAKKHIKDLEIAIEIIREHYQLMAKVLKKEQKYG